MKTLKTYNKQDALKGSLLYASLQIAIVVFSFMRSKILAVFIGAGGIGLMAVYSAPINFISAVVNFGLPFSAIKEIAASSSEASPQRKIAVIRAFFIMLVLLGFLAIAILSGFTNLVNRVYLNSKDFYAVFLITLVVFFNVLADGFKSVLQALRLRRKLAVSSLIGLTISTVISMPILIIFRIDGILFSLVLSSLITVIIMFYFSKGELNFGVKVDKKYLLNTSKGLILSSFKFSLSQQIGTLSKLILIWFLTSRAGLVFVGYYSVGNTFIVTYFGMAINSLSTDFYTKLIGALNEGIENVKLLVQEQLKISLIIVTPVIIVFINTLGFIIRITLSNDFLPIVSFLHIAVLGVYLQILNSILGLISFAAGKQNFFLIFEGVTMNLLSLALAVAGYFYRGLEGMAIFYVIYQFIYTISIVFFLKKSLHLHLDMILLKEFFLYGILILLITVCSFYENKLEIFKFSWVISTITVMFFLNKLMKEFDIRNLVINFLRR